MDLTNDDVADILALLDSLPYDSLDLRTDKFRLTLRRNPGGGWTEESEILVAPTTVAHGPTTSTAGNPDTVSAPRVTSASSAAPGGVAASAGDAADVADAAGTGGAGSAGSAGSARGGGDAGSAADENAPGADGLVAVVAPLPGTFYRAPRPGAEPFVEVGDLVEADTVVAIIETMKLMNSVPAGTPGRVARFVLENGEFASLGTALLLIEPAS